MTEQINRNKQDKWTKDQIIQMITLVLFGLFLLVKERNMDFSTCDDPWFVQQLQENTLGGFLQLRYENWTSRLVIESLLVSIVQWNPWIWRILNAFWIVAIVFSAGRIAFPKGKRKWTFLMAILLLLTPMETLYSAGFAATSINYIWPLGAGMLTMIPLADSLKREQSFRGERVFGLIVCILASNQEQMAAILAGVSLVVLIDHLITQKKWNWYAAVILGISMLQMIFVLICPGNDVRVQTEIIAHFPDFERISLWSKTQIGFLSETAYYFGMAERNYVCIPLFAVLLYTLWKRKSWIALSLQVPVWLIVIFFGYGNHWLLRKEWFGESISVFRNIQPMIFAYEYSKAQIWMEILIYVMCCLLIAAGVYVSAGRDKRGVIAVLILVAGFLSRFILGYSASVYVSGYRTSIFATTSIFLECILLLEPFLPDFCSKTQ